VSAIIGSADTVTKVEYGLMLLFGAGAIAAALLLESGGTQTAVVGLAFGITVGLWLGHLLSMLDRAVGDQAAA
jgi:Flp pilus assembly pilin Flp